MRRNSLDSDWLDVRGFKKSGERGTRYGQRTCGDGNEDGIESFHNGFGPSCSGYSTALLTIKVQHFVRPL